MNKNSGIYEDLITDLMYLRKDRGFVAARLRNASTLLAVLGGASQDFTDLKVRFVSAINSLPDKQAASLLIAVYALTNETAALPKLSERRISYGKRVGLKTDAIAKHENAALRELAIQLLSARYTMAPLPFSANVMPHNATIQEYVEVKTLVKDKLWQETKETYKLISLVDDVGWLEISSSIPATVTSTTAKVKTEPSSGGLRHRFYYDKPLMRGEATTLTFNMSPDEKLADPSSLILLEETRAFHEPTLKARFEVFFIGQVPEIIWQYNHLTFFERPGTPTKQQLLPLEKHNSAQTTFTDLYGGMFSGIAWQW
ncbi:MAG: hypothetical protein FWD27_04625 [Coriobacteriia bacterium]|nr:hypothetical protein [Coriobacteriia bacterium]